jgi:hypothetical protein
MASHLDVGRVNDSAPVLTRRPALERCSQLPRPLLVLKPDLLALGRLGASYRPELGIELPNALPDDRDGARHARRPGNGPGSCSEVAVRMRVPPRPCDYTRRDLPLIDRDQGRRKPASGMRRWPSRCRPASTQLWRRGAREIVDDGCICGGIAAAVTGEEGGHVGPGCLRIGCALQVSGTFCRRVAHRAVRGEELGTVQRERRSAGCWISRLCGVDGQNGCDQDRNSGDSRHGVRSPGVDAGAIGALGPGSRPHEAQSSSSSLWRALPVVASRESSIVRPSRFFALTSYLPCSRSIS